MADIHYQPKVRDLSEAVYFPTDASPEENEVLARILDNYLECPTP